MVKGGLFFLYTLSCLFWQLFYFNLSLLIKKTYKVKKWTNFTNCKYDGKFYFMLLNILLYRIIVMLALHLLQVLCYSTIYSNLYLQGWKVLDIIAAFH